MFADSKRNAIVVVDEMPKGSNISNRNNDTSVDDKEVELASDSGMIAGHDDECRNLRGELKDPGEIVERMSTPSHTAPSHPDDGYDEENGGHATGADDCGTSTRSDFECTTGETSRQFAEDISSDSTKLLSYTHESSESKEATSEVEAGAILPPVKGPSSALPSSSREGDGTHKTSVSSPTNGHSENRITDPFDSPLSALTELPSDSEGDRTRKTPSQLRSNSNIECNGDIPSSSHIAGAKTTSRFASDASFWRDSTSDATSIEIPTPRSSTPSPHLIMDCVIPPPFYFPKELYRPMSEVHPEMVPPSEVKSSDGGGRVHRAGTSTPEEGKVRHRRHRSRSPLHKHDQQQALEIFGSGLTMYSCFGCQGGFQIARGALQCLPEDDGRASFSFPMTDELRRRLEKGMTEAREELAESNLGATSSAKKPRVSKQGTKGKGASKQKGKGTNDRHSSEWSTCHGCAKKTGIPKMVCCAVRSNGTLCTKRFCEMCINRKYPDIQFDEERTDFTCPKCLGICLCAPCSRARDSLMLNQEFGLGVDPDPSTEVVTRRTTSGPKDRKARADDRQKKQDASITRLSMDDSGIPVTESARRKRPHVPDGQRLPKNGKPPGLRSGSPIVKCDVIDEAHIGEAGEGSGHGVKERPSVLGAADRKQLSGKRILNEREEPKFDDDRKNSEPVKAHSRPGRVFKPTEKTRRSNRVENGEPEAVTRQRKRPRTDSISARDPSSSQVLLGSPTYETSRPACDNDGITLGPPIADAIIEST